MQAVINFHYLTPAISKRDKKTMCGILTINSPKLENLNYQEILLSMKHRGPDDHGTYISEKKDCFMGQVRLSILDLSCSGHQPMTDSSGRFVIAFNGEVYNYQKLKNNLAREYGEIDWQSSTDTEVIVEGFAREGITFFEKLNGIFAFTIYDNKEHTLTVLRDPIGVKPLYFTRQNGGVFFASELKALLKITGLKRTIRLQSMAEQLAFMYVPEPYTMFEEFFKHEPGKYAVYKHGKLIDSGMLFSHLHSETLKISEREIIELFSNTFSQAVKRQLVSDVPVSLFLSGGLDSSAITMEALRSGANIKDAYTISFSSQDMKYDGQSDDLHYAKIIARKFGLSLNIIEARQDMLSLLPEIVYHLDDGLADPAAINTYLICKSARENGVKVMLSGQGADEFLGGYRKYSAELLYSKLHFLVTKMLSAFHKTIPVNFPGKLNSTMRRVGKFAKHAGQKPEERIVEIGMWANPKQIKKIMFDKNIEPGQRHREVFNEFRDTHPVDIMMKLDHYFDLMSLNLMYTDKMSMMAGVEARVPFLDLELVKLMNSIPLELKIKNNERKYILKKAMEPHLPKEVIYRSKSGFGSPIRAWLKTESEITKRYFDRDRLKKQGVFNPDYLKTIIQEQVSGRADHGYMLFSFIVLQIWFDIFWHDEIKI